MIAYLHQDRNQHFQVIVDKLYSLVHEALSNYE